MVGWSAADCHRRCGAECRTGSREANAPKAASPRRARRAAVSRTLHEMRRLCKRMPARGSVYTHFGHRRWHARDASGTAAVPDVRGISMRRSLRDRCTRNSRSCHRVTRPRPARFLAMHHVCRARMRRLYRRMPIGGRSNSTRWNDTGVRRRRMCRLRALHRSLSDTARSDRTTASAPAPYARADRRRARVSAEMAGSAPRPDYITGRFG
jgi:hypothetical protein